MHGNPLYTDEPADKLSVTAADKLYKESSRKRYCKKCTFTCTDAREFIAHHAAHTDSDKEDVESFLQNSERAKLRFQRSFRSKCNSKSIGVSKGVVVAEAKGAVIAEAKGAVIAEAKGAVIAEAKGAVIAEAKGAVIAEAKGAVVAEARGDGVGEDSSAVANCGQKITSFLDNIPLSIGYTTEMDISISNSSPLCELTPNELVSNSHQCDEIASSELVPGSQVKFSNFKLEGTKSSEQTFLEHKSSKNDSSYAREYMDIDERGGELDAEPEKTTPTQINNAHNISDNKSLPNHIIDNVSSNIDDDYDVNLVIDDGTIVGNDRARPRSFQDPMYSCSQCDMTTTSARTYAHHMNNVHNIKFNIYECDLCDYATAHKQKLPLHRKQHLLPNGDVHLNSSFYSADKMTLDHVDGTGSFLNKSFDYSPKHDLFIKDEVDDFEDEDDCDTPSRDQTSMSTSSLMTDNIDKLLDDDKKRKKKTRQEVDPGKYFEAVDSEGTKYACSQCGNIYKWRKSLNKHWKEKHATGDLVEAASPPGMLEVLKSGKYTQLGARRIYDNVFLSTIKTTKNDDDTSPATLCHSNHSPSLANLQDITKVIPATTSSLTPPGGIPQISKIVGPFVASSGQAVFPGMPMMLHPYSIQSNSIDTFEEGALDLSSESKPALRISPVPARCTPSLEHSLSFDQDEPLDFSKSTGKTTPELSDSLQPTCSLSQIVPRQQHCSKCGYPCYCDAEIASHTSSHLNKRIFICFECKLQINTMEELNNHFIKLHFQKLSEHKEAIKKIPHGLQQAYHVLNMNIQDICELGNQDLGTAEGKSLKCKKCNFEAKWPAELQKHAVSHSEERPYICMVCGSTYKWKWDLVKHFQKSHPNLPNPYRRNDKRDTTDGSSEDDGDLSIKQPKLCTGDDMDESQYSQDDVLPAAQVDHTLISNQPSVGNDSVMGRNLAFFNIFPFVSQTLVSPATALSQEVDRHKAASKTAQNISKTRHNSVRGRTGSSNGKSATAPSPDDIDSEEILYKCTTCDYCARWPSEVIQHMKNHSETKPYLCPRCEYRSKWKWDVVKHLKRCGGGTIKDVIDTTKLLKIDICGRTGSPIAAVGNGFVKKYGRVKKSALQQPASHTIPSVNENVRSASELSLTSTSSGNEHSRPASRTLLQDFNSSNFDIKDTNANDHNFTSYPSAIPFVNLNPHAVNPSRVSSTSGNILTSSPSPSLMSSSVTQASSSRQSSSGTVWNCPHCPFTTQSQAELKRHSDLHSDDKPFKCDHCQYATRWACDLKKHRKGYNHHPKITNSLPAATEKNENPLPRFKCSQCVTYFGTFDNLLQHRLAEHISHESNQSMIASPAENEIDLARIRHPRKQMKQFQCSKCPFVCKSRQTMAAHMNEHDQFELTGINCFFCSAPFRNKESLLDHIITHSTFNPCEWETFFMISDDELNMLKTAKMSNYRKDIDKSQHDETKKKKVTHEVKDQSKRVADSDIAEARIKKILDEIPKQMTVTEETTFSSQFKCEWCTAEFGNLTALYKHASHAHPKQLKDQDIDVNLSTEVHIPKSQSDQSIPVSKRFTEVTDVLKQQVKEKRSRKMEKDSVPRVEVNKKRKLNVVGDTESSSCAQFGISTSNLSTVENHLQLNGSSQPCQCWFCDFSVDQMNLLYQHMKISHARKWKAASQDPKYAPYIRRINMALARNGIHSNSINNLSSNTHDALDLRFERETHPSLTTGEIIYKTRQQSTWNDVPVNVAPVGTSFNFVCPHCDFQDSLIDSTCSHVTQSHRPMLKFTCKTCQYSHHNIHNISDHCKKDHPPTERIVEVINFQQITFDESQIAHLNALRERVAVGKKDPALDLTSVLLKTMCCPFCPFKTLNTDHMKDHVSGHSRQASYQCHVCDYSSDYSTAINDHVKVHDSEYILDNRSLCLTKSEAATKNEFAKTKMDELESRVVVRAPPAMKHVEDGYKDEEVRGRSKFGKRIRYRCSVCPYHSTCRNNMVKHKRQHNNNKKYKCCKCSYSAARAVLLKNHIDSHEKPVEDEDQYYDIFCDPNSPNDNFENDDESGEAEVENVIDDDDDDDDISEMDAKAIADLEAKDILKAESTLKVSVPLEGRDNVDKLLRKQRCTLCPFSSMSVSELRKHLSCHGAHERYKCDHCSYSIDRLNLLNQHRRLHVDETGYVSNTPTANLLNTTFILQQNLETTATCDQTIQVIADEDNSELSNSHFSCKLCPFTTSKRKHFKAHSTNHGSRKFYICDFCDWATDHIGNLHHHRRVHETEPLYNPKPEDNVFLNQECDGIAAGEFEARFMEFKNVSKQGNEDQREESVLPPYTLSVVKKNHQCKLCPFTSSSKNSYFAHNNMHNSGLEFACNKCSYASMNRGLLLQHLHLHTSGVEDTAPFVKGNLNGHEVQDVEVSNETLFLVSKSEKPAAKVNQFDDSSVSSELECQRCPFTASSQNALNDHIKGHVNHDSLKCPYCDFSAPSRQIMSPHIQIHFPGTNIELEALEHIMEEHAKRICNNSHIFNNNNHDKLKSLSPNLDTKPVEEGSEVHIKRVYVCQYCEREFEAKQLMIQHEKQHLIGSL